MLNSLVSALLAYLIGSVSFPYWTARLLKLDLFKAGSKASTGTNFFRSTKSIPLTILAGGLDIAKGAVAVMLLPAPHIAAVFVVLGHIKPVFTGFRGGRGASAAIGAMLVLEPLLVLYTLALIIPFWLVLGHPFWGEYIVFFLLPALSYFLSGSAAQALSVSGIALLLILAHYPKLKRLLSSPRAGLLG